MSTYAYQFADWAAGLKYSVLPDECVHEVKRRVIDSLGCALGAYRSPTAKVAREAAMAVRASEGSSVLGTRHRTTPDLAAFANGAMVRYLDFNDTYLSREPAHPSDNIPPALAVAQAAGRSGKHVILATAIGYEVQCRLCDAASLRANGWDHVTYLALSTALLAGKLWNLKPQQLEHALGLAGVCNTATRQARTGQLSMWKGCAASNAARNGVFAANLARLGMTGPSDIFEGPCGIMRQLTGPFDMVPLATRSDWMINRTYVKYWPAEYHSQSAIDAILQLRSEIGGTEVRSIRINSFEAAVSIIGSEPEKWRPTSRETADHSLPFCVAVALADGELTRRSFAPARLKDKRILDLMDRIEIREDAGLNEGYPEGIPNDLIVTLADGRTLRKRVDFPRGHHRNPMSDEEVEQKFCSQAEGVISPRTADRILAAAWNLDRLTELSPLVEFGVRKPA
jgi:2-methylcitrate dehydratase